MSSHLKLNCLILGQDASRVFSVEIASTKSVYNLKTAIKNLHPNLGNLSACTLDLFKVSYPDDGSLEQNLIEFKPKKEDSLSPVNKLWEVWEDNPDSKHLHIIVQIRGEFV
jgi:Crinkler effector protein N-terminal domain